MLLYGSHILRRYGFLQSEQAIGRIEFKEGARFHLHTQKKVLAGDLRGDSIVTTWILLLRFRIPEQKFPQSILVFRDSLPRGEYRRLVVGLKWIYQTT